MFIRNIRITGGIHNDTYKPSGHTRNTKLTEEQIQKLNDTLADVLARHVSGAWIVIKYEKEIGHKID